VALALPSGVTRRKFASPALHHSHHSRCQPSATATTAGAVSVPVETTDWQEKVWGSVVAKGGRRRAGWTGGGLPSRGLRTRLASSPAVLPAPRLARSSPETVSAQSWSLLLRRRRRPPPRLRQHLRRLQAQRQPQRRRRRRRQRRQPPRPRPQSRLEPRLQPAQGSLATDRRSQTSRAPRPLCQRSERCRWERPGSCRPRH